MTDWTTLTDDELNSGKPVLFTQARAIRDNVTALAQAAPGAPQITPAAFGGLTTGTVPVFGSTISATSVASSTTPVKVKSVTMPFAGTYKIRAMVSNSNGGGGLHAQMTLKVNGSTVASNVDQGAGIGYCEHDVTVSNGDTLDIYVNASGSGNTVTCTGLSILANTGMNFVETTF